MLKRLLCLVTLAVLWGHAAFAAGPLPPRPGFKPGLNYSFAGLPPSFNYLATQNWRLPVLDSISSDSAFATAMEASSNSNRNFPSRNVTAGTLTETWQIPAVSAPGALTHWYTTATTSGVTAEVSFDSTNGTDGTWTTVPAQIRARTSTTNAQNSSQLQRWAAGGARWVRMNITFTGSGALYMKHYQRTLGNDPILGSIGSSKENASWQPMSIWNTIKELEQAGTLPAGLDVIPITYSESSVSDSGAVDGGDGIGGTLGNMEKLVADFPEVKYFYSGTVGGVAYRTTRPYSSTDSTFRNGMAATWDMMHNISVANNLIPFHGLIDYRDSNPSDSEPSTKNVNGWANPENGSHLYSIGVYLPRLTTLESQLLDTSRNLPLHFDFFSTGIKYWFTGPDGNHQSTEGYHVLRRERLLAWGNWVMTGSIPAKNIVDRGIDKAEASLYYWDYYGPYEMLQLVPSSTWKTAAQARLAAIASQINPDVVNFLFGQASGFAYPSCPNCRAGYAPYYEPNWNFTSTRNTVSVQFDPVSSPPRFTDGRTATGYGWENTAVTGTVQLSSGGGASVDIPCSACVTVSGLGLNNYSDGPIDDAFLEGSMQLGTSGSITGNFTVPGTLYDVYVMSSLNCTLPTSTSNLSATIGGVAKTINPCSADGRGNRNWEIWTNVAPSGGKIAWNFARASSSTPRIQAVRLVNKGSVADLTPDAWAFTDVTGASTATLTASNVVTITGINASAGVSISGTGCEYRVNAGTWTAVSGSLVNNDTIQARTTSSASYSTATACTVNVGTSSDNWSVTTAAPPGAPTADSNAVTVDSNVYRADQQ